MRRFSPLPRDGARRRFPVVSLRMRDSVRAFHVRMRALDLALSLHDKERGISYRDSNCFGVFICRISGLSLLSVDPCAAWFARRNHSREEPRQLRVARHRSSLGTSTLRQLNRFAKMNLYEVIVAAQASR